MNVLSQPGTSDYQNRTVIINVTGVRRQSVLKQGSYQVRVPYSQMSQAMQTIHRQGGQIASVRVGGDLSAQASDAAEGNSQAARESSGDNSREDNSREDGEDITGEGDARQRSSKRKRR